MPLLLPLVVAALLFAIGLYGVLGRRHAVLVLMGVELMLNATNLMLVAFDAWLRDRLVTGQVLTLFVITVAAAEVGLGLAIVLLVFRQRGTVALDEVADLGEAPGPAPYDDEPATGAYDHELTTSPYDGEAAAQPAPYGGTEVR